MTALLAAALGATLASVHLGGAFSAGRGVLLGLVQGLTEFLPVSSSGHLQILSWLAGWEEMANDRDLWTTFEVLLHFGTLLGAVIYFRRDVRDLLIGGLASLSKRRRSAEGKLAWLLILASVPVGVVGAAAGRWMDNQERVWVTAVALAVFGVALWGADKLAAARGAGREVAEVGWVDAVWLGLAQTLALIPGVSRSGVVMTAGRLLGLARVASARVALLMSMPVIFGAAVFKLIDTGAFGGIPPEALWAFLWGTLAAAVSGWVAVWLLMRLTRRIAFGAFALYRVGLAAVVLSLVAASVRGASWG